MSFLSSIGDAIGGIEKALGPMGEIAKVGLDVATMNPMGLAQDAASLLGGQSGSGGNAGLSDIMSLFGGSGGAGSGGGILGDMASLFGGGSSGGAGGAAAGIGEVASLFAML